MFISASTAVAAPAEPLGEEQTPFSPAARGKMSQEKAGTKRAARKAPFSTVDSPIVFVESLQKQSSLLSLLFC